MIKINYPTNSTALAALESDYYSILNLTHANISAINIHLRSISFLGFPLTLDRLVKLKFDELMLLSPYIIQYSNNVPKVSVIKNNIPVLINPFDELFNYDNNQPSIAAFFMRHRSFDLKTCHYCGIDYVNAFTDLDDYSDGYDFINRANLKDLQKIKGIGPKKANWIIKERKRNLFTDLNKVSSSINIRRYLTNFELEMGHNHFTLDHVLPQKTYKFYSLCLYNFVPSCYSCNSKFKKAIEFPIDNDLKYISPTSKDYSFTEDFKFQLFYKQRLNDIKKVSDFILQKTIINNKDHILHYFAMFKIDGRYIFHKDKILPLIEKKIKYPDSTIKEISKATGLSQKEIKYMIFGKELFEPSFSNQPFLKLKRDIAKDIGIDGVI